MPATVGGTPGQRAVVTESQQTVDIGLATHDVDLIVAIEGIGPAGATGPTGPAGGGGGGGGPSGTSIIWTPSVATYPTTGGKRAVFSNWKAGNTLSGTAVGFTSPAGVEGFAFNAAGWYSIQWMIWSQFLAGTAPLPDRVVFQWSTWDGVDGDMEIPLSDASALNAVARVGRGISTFITTPVFHDPGYAVAGDSTVWANLTWPGDATLTSGTNSGVQYALRAIATRVG